MCSHWSFAPCSLLSSALPDCTGRNQCAQVHTLGMLIQDGRSQAFLQAPSASLASLPGGMLQDGRGAMTVQHCFSRPPGHVDFHEKMAQLGTKGPLTVAKKNRCHQRREVYHRKHKNKQNSTAAKKPTRFELVDLHAPLRRSRP